MSRPAAVLFASLVTALAVAGVGCSGAPPRGRSGPDRREAAAPAVTALRDGRFADSDRAAARVLAGDPDNSVAAAVRAIARYREIMERLWRDLSAVGAKFDREDRNFDDGAFRAALMRAEAALADVDRDLARAAADPDFSLELCIACWKQDWNGNGRVDEGDQLLFQVEMDADGHDIPEGDPRRSPTFRFDTGDAHWARAMVAFQRAGMNLVAAFRWQEVDKAAASLFSSQPQIVRFPLDDAARVRRARDLILAGLDHADRSRQAYLAESDDEREWLPSPRQVNHPLPLTVDARLYDTWDAVIDDVRRLVRGQEGLDLAEIVRLGAPGLRIRPGYLDIGRMLSAPRDIVIDLPALEKLDRESAAGLEAALRSFFGAYYVDSMRPSPLVGRLARMRAEIDRGEDSFGRKLRYLLWLN
ncbi:MAG TPA: hypothetical protein VKB80_04670 [Kofleriaceae bacterium]|nr:hypothetical protein [Kofleriaceae bacterium]